MARQNKTLTFDTELLKKANRLAKRERRSFNNWLETLIVKEIENNKPIKTENS